jgi:hypothetical protein
MSKNARKHWLAIGRAQFSNEVAVVKREGGLGNIVELS